MEIFRRTLRDRAMSGVAGLVIVAAALLFEGQRLTTMGQQSGVGRSIMGIAALTLIAPLVGLMIGFAHLFLESHGDAWGFQVHRPVSRFTLFWGKALAGMVLYLFATVIPLAVLTVWLAAGYLPVPFDWRIILPGVADMLCGLVFYFAGLLIAMRDARWYGSRVAGIGVGLACSIAVLGVRDFWQAAIICLAGIVVTAVAALGTFVTGGVYESQPRVTRAALGVTVGSSILMLGVLSVFSVVYFMTPSASTGRSTIFALAKDGQVVRTLRDNGGRIVSIEDLNGRIIDQYSDAESRKDFTSGVVIAEALINPDWRPAWSYGYRMVEDIFLPLNEESFEGWYYIHDLGLIAVYDNRPAKLIGWIGPGGFSAGETRPEQRFNGPLKNRMRLQQSLLVFAESVYRIDVRARRVEKIFTTRAGESVLGAAASNVSQDALLAWGEASRFDVIVTTQKLVVQSHEGVLQLSAPLDPAAAGYGTAAVYRPLQAGEPRWSVWYYALPGTRPGNQLLLPVLVTEFDNDGKTLAHHSLKMEFTIPPSSSLAISPWLVMPLMTRLVESTGLLPEHLYLPTGETPMQRLLAWILPLITSLVSAIIIFALGHAFGIGHARLWLWVALGLALGLFGMALMLALLDWPARETCPSCSRKRSVTNERCEHCGTPFPAPPPDGTEIFESP